MMANLKRFAKTMKRQLLVLYVACKDERVPMIPKLLAVVVVAYAFSPIDLIPDFIPILGYLDDVILLPLGIALVLKLIPKQVLNDCREQASEIDRGQRPANRTAAVIFILIWIALALWLGKWLVQFLT